MRFATPVVLCFALLAGACSGDDNDTKSFCENRVELQESVQGLADVDLLNNGVEALDTQLDVIMQNIDELRASAADLQPEVDAVRAGFADLQSSVTSATTLADKAGALTSGLSDLTVAWNDLTAAADANCN